VLILTDLKVIGKVINLTLNHGVLIANNRRIMLDRTNGVLEQRPGLAYDGGDGCSGSCALPYAWGTSLYWVLPTTQP
jgi:hypothetical protein